VANTVPQNPVQVVTINDFSPGIVRYTVGQDPVWYSPTAPVGSASSAFRCRNAPGIGLIPFYNYTTPFQFPGVATGAGTPDGSAVTAQALTGVGCIGGLSSGEVTSIPDLTQPQDDLLVIAVTIQSAIGEFYTYGYRAFFYDRPWGQIQGLWWGVLTAHPSGCSFDQTTQWELQTTGPGGQPNPPTSPPIPAPVPPATTPPAPTPPPAGANWNFTQLRQLWQSVGGGTQTITTNTDHSYALDWVMAAIAKAESRGNPNAGGPPNATGLWQIDPGTTADFNPTVNAENAVAKYNSQGLEAWDTYTGAGGGQTINGIYYPLPYTAFLGGNDPVATFPAPGLTAEVIDQGVDFPSLPSGSPLLAVGDGTITYINPSSGWEGQMFMVLTLTDWAGLPSPNVYYAEGVVTAHTVGDVVSAGDQIATTDGGPTGIEIGFATTSVSTYGDISLASQLGQTGGDPHTTPPPAGVPASGQGTPSGAAFWNWIHALGPYAGGAASTQPGPGGAPAGSTAPPAGTTVINRPTSMLICQPYVADTYYTPTQVSGFTYNTFPWDKSGSGGQVGAPTGLNPIPILAALCHGNRVGVIQPSVYVVGNLASLIMQGDDAPAWSDPLTLPVDPATLTPPVTDYKAVYYYYTLENASGFGAWGSVSTGELIFIRRGQGGIIVSSDPAYPSAVTKLPAVHGTGQIMQRMTQCLAGSLYVTETDGVYAWNGGNTSQKISSQIPDQAALRTDLEPGGVFGEGVVGVRIWHDVLNNLVFFPHNWIYDSGQNSWWQCEDPGVFDSGGWAASGSGVRWMYGVDGSPTDDAFPVRQFDATSLASSYEWISNPLPSSTETLTTVISVELVASNPSPTAATVTITPTIPPGNISTFANNPQTIVFNIPPEASGYTASLPLGFTEWNVCLRLDAANSDSANPAPAIHALNISIIEAQTAGIT